jgi:hypothetical protein
MARAVSKLRGAGVLALLLRAVVVVAVVGAHDVRGAPVELGQHEAMVRHTVRARDVRRLAQR